MIIQHIVFIKIYLAFFLKTQALYGDPKLQAEHLSASKKRIKEKNLLKSQQWASKDTINIKHNINYTSKAVLRRCFEI